jgi:hypothetical protein
VIDFRFFLVSIAAVFLALAVGVALGAGPLKGEIDQQLRANVTQLSDEKDDLRTQMDALERADRYRDTFATTIAPGLIANKLNGHQVVLVALPGSDRKLLKTISDSIKAANGTVTGTVEVTQKWGDPTNRQFMEDLTAQVIPGDIDLPSDGTAYDRAGALLARAVVTKDAKQIGQPDSGTTTIIGAFAEGDLVKASDKLPRGDLAVVVAPVVKKDQKPPEGDDPNLAWVAIAKAMDSASRGAVVVGDQTTASELGMLASLRADTQITSQVSSVDVANLPSGQVAMVWALLEQAQGKAGQYGAVGTTDGALPKLSDAS